jgi:hypothetical protein
VNQQRVAKFIGHNWFGHTPVVHQDIHSI